MFEKEYQEVFSQVRASDDLTRRVMTMKQEINTRSGRSLLRLAVAVALIVVMALTVTASEEVQNWFVNFFAGLSRDGLSQDQVEYIEENVQILMESQTHNGWTIELNSAIRNEISVYIVFRIIGPENVDLSQWMDEQGNLRGQLDVGNSTTFAYLNGVDTFFDFDENIERGGWGYYWMDDGDGKAYTENLVVFMTPETMVANKDPFGVETVYHFRFQDIVWFWVDTKYELELRSQKYPGQAEAHYTVDELRKIHRCEILAEGIWEFYIEFSKLTYVEGETIDLQG